MKILIIGGGNMGITYARAFINSRVVAPDQLMILEKSLKEKMEELSKLQLAKITAQPDCIGEADLVIIAVKPQDISVLFDEIRPWVSPSQVVLSIMAGVKMERIRVGLGIDKIVRAMPNLPAQIGAGMTVFTTTDAVTRLEQGAVQNLLATTGKTLLVEEEKMLDVATAISGSGPAYVYYFMEAMIQAGKELGFEPAQAQLLVSQTFNGALQLFQQNAFSCEEWIKKVASKGGTTEAALSVFRQNEVANHIGQGAMAAFQRAVELSKS
jgi:pyrroline-5-carboxylate reductase